MIKLYDCEQRSPEWFTARAGIPTASEFATVLAKGKDGGDSKTRKAYMLKLAGERLTGEPMDSYDNAYMQRGREMEGEARALYEFLQDEPLTRVGFIRDGDKGCSPDSLVGTNGVCEIKTALAHILIGYILKGDFPPEHKAQCQGALWVAEREWIDIAIYWPKLPLFVKRAYRDEPYIKELSKAVDQFNVEIAEAVDRVKQYGQPSNLREKLKASVNG